MKKILLSVIAIFSLSQTTQAQAYMEGFESTALPFGWDTLNNSGPTKGVAFAWWNSASASSPPAAYEGSDYFVSNYQAVAATGDISTWLFTPMSLLMNGDEFSFASFTLGDGTYPDRMEIRLSTSGTSQNVGSTPTSVGDFSVVLGVINPSLTSTGYPQSWTSYKYVLSGLPGAGVNGKFAFRYFVTNGGPSGSNSDAVGVDSVYYKPVTATGISSAANNNHFAVFPNPSTGHVNISFPTPSERIIVIQNLVGEVLVRESVSRIENKIDLTSFAKGIYLINIIENNVVRTEKLTIQ